MARDRGDDPGRRGRWGRGKPEEGPSDEDLGWLADLRASAGDRALDDPRPRRAEPPTGAVNRPPSPGPAGPPPQAGPPQGPPPGQPVSPPPVDRSEPRPPSRGWLRRTPSSPPPEPPPVLSPPTPPARSGGARPMIDWDEDGDLPPADPRGRREPRTGDVRTPTSPTPYGPPATSPAGRPAELRTGGLRAPAPAPNLPPPNLPAPMPNLAPPNLPAPMPNLPPPNLPAAMPPPMPPPPLPGPPPPDMMTTGMIQRAELRRHMKIQQQLKSITLGLVVVLLLAAYPVFVFARSAAADPVFAGLDALSLSSDVAYEHTDRADGSRWCIGQCMQRMRKWSSTLDPQPTLQQYAKALQDAGWHNTCQREEDNGATLVSCWTKDEYVMVMYIQAPLCEAPPARDPVPTASASAGAGEGVADGAQTQPDHTCPAASVTMYISNAVDEQSTP